MAYSETLSLVAGDTLPILNLTLKDSNTAAAGAVLDEENSSTWAPINITGAAVRLRVRELGDTEVKDTRLCSVTEGTNGVCITNFSSATFATSGTYEGEIEITFDNGSIHTVYDLIKFKVREDF